MRSYGVWPAGNVIVRGYAGPNPAFADMSGVVAETAAKIGFIMLRASLFGQARGNCRLNKQVFGAIVTEELPRPRRPYRRETYFGLQTTHFDFYDGGCCQIEHR